LRGGTKRLPAALSVEVLHAMSIAIASQIASNGVMRACVTRLIVVGRTFVDFAALQTGVADAVVALRLGEL